MIIEIILAITLGISFGIITGLIPGIHINLVSVLLLSASPILLTYTSAIALAVFIISMSVTHTFLDAIPSIYLGAPDSDMALGVLPGHKMLLKGEGFGAVHLTVVGGLGALILAILLVPYLIKSVGLIYPLIKNYIGYFLIIIVVFMILRENLKLYALFLFLLSGTLGAIVLGIPNLKNPLFPLLSGLFGVSALALSYMQKVKIPKQIIKKEKINLKIAVQALAASTFAGTLTSFFPGLGPAQGAVIAQQLTKDIGDKGFLVLIGGINTVNMVLSLVTLFVLDKARNGSVIAVSKLIQINILDLFLLLLTALFTGILCYYLALFLAKKFSFLITKVNYQYLITAVILLITVLSIVLTGSIGILILIVSASTGLIAPLSGISRSHAMGCLMLPVIMFFIL